MNFLKHFSLSVLLFIFGCASTSHILSDHDSTVDFGSYATFILCTDDLKVDHIKNTNLDNSFIRGLIGNEIESQMTILGYQNNTLNPQLQAGFKIDINEEAITFSNCDTEGEIDYWETCTINTAVYTNETLIVSVSDIAKNQVIWQASITCDLNKPEKDLPKHIQELIKQLFERYPLDNNLD